MNFHLLQVCNVGQIVGGTGACTLSVVKSLPEIKHSVVCLGKISPDMSRIFKGVDLYEWKSITQKQVEQVQPDLVLFHNTHQRRVEDELFQVTLHYVHSRITPVKADRTMYCSRWLADQYQAKEEQVCLQSVFKPLISTRLKEEDYLLRKGQGNDPGLPEIKDDRQVRVGRICTPQLKKWPGVLIEMYEKLSQNFPQICWEFVGCPEGMQQKLLEACKGRAKFIPAKWEAREHLWEWDIMLYHNPDVTESFGRTVAESMRSACIPIVDNRGGFREQIIPGTGYLCDTHAEFEQALRELMDNDLRKEMSFRCKEHSDQQFSLRRFGDDLLDQFQAACGVSA